MSVGLGHLNWLAFVPFTIVMGSLWFIILAAILGKPERRDDEY